MSKRQNEKTLSKLIREELTKLLGTVIYNPETNELNGVPLEKIEERLSKQPKLPDGFLGACYLHDTPLYFKSLDDMKQHELERHRV